MKNEKIKFILCALFFTVLAVITFRCVFSADHVFSASDLNVGRLAYRKGNLPASLTGSFGANQIMGSSAYGFTLFNLLLALLPLEFFANAIYALILIGASLALLWFLRIWKLGWLASIFGALAAFWFNSITLASSGHAYKMEVLAFSVLGLCFVEKSIRSAELRRSIGYSILAGLSLGLMVIEQQDVALLAGLFVASYSVFRLFFEHRKTLLRWVSLLIPVIVTTAVLSGTTVLKSYSKNIKGAASVQGDADEKWNYITQWSMVPSEWPDLVAPGWGGWSSGNPDGPYWGKIGQSAEWGSEKSGFQNFKLDSIYIGIVPFLLAGFGLWVAILKRKEDDAKFALFWSVATLGALVLSFGKYSVVYKGFYHLPMINNIRAPIKLLDNFEICLAIVAAYGLDRLLKTGLKAKASKILWIVCAVVSGGMFVAGARLAASPSGVKKGLGELGYSEVADVIMTNMSHAWVHAGILSLITGLVIFLVWRFKRSPVWGALVLLILLSVDSLLMTKHYFRAQDISSLKRGNSLINYLKENQGDERLCFVEQAGPYAQWVASDAAYHGLNLFNIWQMPRMPVEYKKYLGEVKTWRDQVRIWQLSSVKYMAAPVGFMGQLQQMKMASAFQPIKFYRFVPEGKTFGVQMLKRPERQGDQVLLEYKNAIPRFALFHGWSSVPLDKHCNMLFDPTYDPTWSVLIDSAEDFGMQESAVRFDPISDKNVVTGKKNISLSLEVSGESPAILRFSQRYQSGWTVFLDGVPEKLLKVDFLCMGVKVPPGKHVVEFRCVSGIKPVLFSVAVFVVFLGGSIVLLWKGKGHE